MTDKRTQALLATLKTIAPPLHPPTTEPINYTRRFTNNTPVNANSCSFATSAGCPLRNIYSAFRFFRQCIPQFTSLPATTRKDRSNQFAQPQEIQALKRTEAESGLYVGRLKLWDYKTWADAELRTIEKDSLLVVRAGFIRIEINKLLRT